MITDHQGLEGIYQNKQNFKKDYRMYHIRLPFAGSSWNESNKKEGAVKGFPALYAGIGIPIT